MTESFKSWWRTRTLREQRLLLAMAGLLAAVLAWMIVIRPLSDSLSEARERHGDAVVALAEARARAATLASLRNNADAPPLVAPLDTILSQSATEAGFQVTRLEREGPNQATVVIGAVRPQAFFGWVSQVEGQHGVKVDRLSATTNTDQTLAVQVTFRARAG
jgi:general secretion pathway protein M